MKKPMNKITRMIMGVMIITTSFAGMGQEVPTKRLFEKWNEKTVTIICPVTPLKFRSPVTASDTLYLGVAIDSISSDLYVGRLFAYYPKNTEFKGSGIKIGYPNGKIDYFPTSSEDTSDSLFNYSDYVMTRDQMDRLKELRYDYVGFEKIANCVNIKQPNYFKEFLRNY